MQKIREILRLSELGLSERKISKALDVSRTVVSDYLRKFKAAGCQFHEVADLPDDQLKERLRLLTKARTDERFEVLLPLLPEIAKELTKPKVTLTLLWEEYCRTVASPYSWTQFRHHFRQWKKLNNVSMVQHYKAGDKMLADFAGTKLHYIDLGSGRLIPCEVFVSILGASQLIYVEAARSQKKQDWIKVNENAFHFYGGVTQAVVPDNLKSAVTTASKYEPDINPEYSDFARHYGTVILPTRPAHPKDKALVEGAVQIVYNRIYAPLRNQRFTSLAELNAAILSELENLNKRKMQRHAFSRQELFETVEKNYLQPLPLQRYKRKNFAKQKVQFNYHVFLREDNRYYSRWLGSTSVPYRFIGREVSVIYTANTVEIYHNNERIAAHCRSGSDRYCTIPGHMPKKHQWMRKWSPERFSRWATDIGPETKMLIEKVLERAKHPEQAYKVCLGILKLKEKYNQRRLNKACRRALEFESYSYKAVSNILQNNLEDIHEQMTLVNLPIHTNVRGGDYYAQEEGS